MASPMLDLHPDSTAEVIHIEDGTQIITQITDSTGGVFGIIAEHMDITEPLTTLRALLEHRLGISLADYTFYLQDVQELDASKNLVNQCVQGEGLVQINVDVTTKGGVKKINIVDVLKPAEEIALSSDFVIHGSDSSASDSTVVRKVILPPPDDTEQVTRWMAAPEFRLLQEKFKIPLDPVMWAEEHVKQWVTWAAMHFGQSNINMNDWKFTGKELMQLSHDDFAKKVPYDPGDIFWTHFELLRKCKIVAVIQSSSSVQQQFQGVNSTSKGVGLKSRVKTARIGTPRIAYEGCPGNNGQIQLWQFLLELLTDKDHREYIQWVGTEGEFKLINPEMVAQLWGQRKNKPTMNYEKLSRALRYYYDGEMIAKVHGKRFVYKFVCDLKSLLGYDASELNRLVSECEIKRLEKGANILSYGTVKVSSNS